jgi:hypothetical protein
VSISRPLLQSEPPDTAQQLAARDGWLWKLLNRAS